MDPMLEGLCRERYGSLIGYATLLTGSRPAAEDVVQQALIAVFSKRRRFDHIGAAEAYVRRAISTTFLDTQRGRRRARAMEQRFAATAPPHHEDPEPEGAQLERVVATLPPRVRACVVLRFMDDLSVRETAQALGLSEGAVKRYVSDGLRALNAALGTNEEFDDAATAEVTSRGGAR